MTMTEAIVWLFGTAGLIVTCVFFVRYVVLREPKRPTSCHFFHKWEVLGYLGVFSTQTLLRCKKCKWFKVTALTADLYSYDYIRPNELVAVKNQVTGDRRWIYREFMKDTLEYLNG